MTDALSPLSGIPKGCCSILGRIIECATLSTLVLQCMLPKCTNYSVCWLSIPLSMSNTGAEPSRESWQESYIMHNS